MKLRWTIVCCLAVSAPLAAADPPGGRSPAAGADPKELLKGLQSRYQSDRMHAVEEIRKLDAAGKKALVDDLTKLIEAGNWQPLRCAAMALGEMGPIASGSVERLKAAVLKYVKAKRGAAVELLQKALSRIDPKAGGALVDGLVKLLSDEEAGVRLRACEALARIGKAARPSAGALTELVKGKDEYVAIAAAKALGKVGAGSEAAGALAGVLQSENTGLVLAALRSLGEIGPEAAGAIEPVSKLPHTRGVNAFLANEAIRTLGKLGPKAIRAVVQGMTSRARGADRTALSVLGGMGAPAVEVLTKELNGKQKVNAAAALVRIGKGRAEEALAVLLEATGSKNSRDARTAVDTLGRYGPDVKDAALRKQMVRRLIAMLKEKDNRHADRAIYGLVGFGKEAKDAVPVLKRIASGKSRDADRAKRALEDLKEELQD